MEKESAHARGVGVGADGNVDNVDLKSSSSSSSKQPEKLAKAPLEPSTPDAAAAAAANAAAAATATANKKNKPLKDTKNAEGSSSRPRFWTRSSSSRLNQPIEGEGADLEAERLLHLAHEKHQTVPAASAPCSPGAGVAAAMAKLGRESLSMSD